MKRCLVLLSVMALCFVIGCGKGAIKTEGVTGVVKLDGTPLAGANVTFIPKVSGQGSPAYALTDEQGVYRLQTMLGAADAGTTTGEYTVLVVKNQEVDTGKTKSIGGNAEAPVNEVTSVVPAVYGDSNQSPLTYTVQKGKNTFDIELDSSAQ